MTSNSADINTQSGNTDDEQESGSIINRILQCCMLYSFKPCCVYDQRRQRALTALTADVGSINGTSIRSNTSLLAVLDLPETLIVEEDVVSPEVEDMGLGGIQPDSASSASSSPQSPTDTPSFVNIVSSMFGLLLPIGLDETSEDDDYWLESIFSGETIGALFGTLRPPQQKPTGNAKSGTTNAHRYQFTKEPESNVAMSSVLPECATGSALAKESANHVVQMPYVSTPQRSTRENNISSQKEEIHSDSNVVRSRSLRSATRRLGSLFLHSPRPQSNNPADPQSEAAVPSRMSTSMQDNIANISADPSSPDIYLTNAYPDMDQVPPIEILTARQPKGTTNSSDCGSNPSIVMNENLLLPHYTSRKHPALGLSLQMPSETSEEDTSSKKSTSTNGFNRPKSILKTSNNYDRSSRSQTPSSRGNRVVFFEQTSEAHAVAPINGQQLLANRLLNRGQQGSEAGLESPKRSIIDMVSAALAMTPAFTSGELSDEEAEVVDNQVQIRNKCGTLLQRSSSMVKENSIDKLSQSLSRQCARGGNSRKNTASQGTDSAEAEDIVINLDGSLPSRGRYSPLRLFTPPRSPKPPGSVSDNDKPKVTQFSQDRINSTTDSIIKERKKAKRKKPLPLPPFDSIADTTVEALSREATVAAPISPGIRNRELLSGAPSPEVRRQYAATPPSVKHHRSFLKNR